MSIKKSLNSLPVILAIVALLLGSCLKNQDYTATEKENIENFLSSNPDLEFSKKESGLYYYEVTPGTGEAIRTNDTAYIIYTLKFLDGHVIETTVGASEIYKFQVGVQDVIPGFDEGVSYMKEDGKSMFLIPSSLAYGPTGVYNQYGYLLIPGYTPLLYDVTLAKIGRAPGK